MRTNVVLDDELVAQAQALSGVRTKREVIDLALREFVALRKRLDLRELKGQDGLSEGYDHKALREGKARR